MTVIYDVAISAKSEDGLIISVDGASSKDVFGLLVEVVRILETIGKDVTSIRKFEGREANDESGQQSLF